MIDVLIYYDCSTSCGLIRDTVWFIHELEVRIWFWSSALWPSTSCASSFPLRALVLYGEMIPQSSLNQISLPPTTLSNVLEINTPGRLKGTQSAMGPRWPAHYFCQIEKRLPQPEIRTTRRIHLEISFNLALCFIRSSIFELKSIFEQTLLIVLHFFIVRG